MPTVNIEAEEKRRALNEVLQSATFFRADQLRNFLRYICEMEIEGRGSELCEALIGVEAFGRPPGYTPAEDGSVRRRALDLREKLQDVYASELANSKFRIELPKGRYVPRFVRIETENGVEAVSDKPVLIQPGAHEVTVEPIQRVAPTQLEAGRQNASLVFRRRFGILCFACGWLAGALMVGTVAAFHWRPASKQPVLPHEIPPHVEPMGSGVSYEAESSDNTLSGMAQIWPCDWCSQGARVRYIGKRPRNYLSLNHIKVAKDGNYEMVIYYVLEGTRFLQISVNDSSPIKLMLIGKDWKQVTSASTTVPLKAGENKVRFYNDEGYAPDIDRIVIR